MKFIQTTTSFKAGQLSRKLDGRIDIEEYRHGCRELQNSIVMKEGGSRTLPGSTSKLYSEFKTNNEVFVNPNENTDIIFSVSNEDNLTVSVIDSDLNTLTAYPLSQSWGSLPTLNPFDISMTQFERYIFITHKSGEYRPVICTISESGSYVFSDFQPNPILPGDSSEVDPFNFFGGWYKFPFETVAEINNKLSITRTGANSYTLSISDGNIEDYTDVGEMLYATIPFKDASNVFGVASNYFQILTVSGNTATARGTLDLPTEADGSYEDWSYSAFGKRNGWPRICTTHESRLIFAGTKRKPLTLYGSAVSNPFFLSNKRFTLINVTIEGSLSYIDAIENTDPYVFTVSSDTSSQILFAKSNNSLLIGVDDAVFTGGTSDGGLLGPLNVSFKKAYSINTSNITPALVNNTLYFAGGNGKQLHVFESNPVNGISNGKDVSILSSDIYEAGIVDLTYIPIYNLLHITKADGTSHYMSVTKESNVLAHSIVDFDETINTYQSIYLPKAEKFLQYGKYVDTDFEWTSIDADNYYAVLEQSLSELEVGTTNEYFTHLKVDRVPRDIIGTPPPPNPSFIIEKGSEDSSGYIWKIHEFAPNTEVYCFLYDSSGELKSYEIHTTDENRLITLNSPVEETDLKFSYGVALETRRCLMPVEAGQQWGSAQYSVKRVDSVMVRLYKSYSFEIGEASSRYMDEVIVFDTDTQEAFTGIHEVKISSTPDRDQVICISNSRPEPLTILALTLRGQSNDG